MLIERLIYYGQYSLLIAILSGIPMKTPIACSDSRVSAAKFLPRWNLRTETSGWTDKEGDEQIGPADKARWAGVFVVLFAPKKALHY